MISQFPTFTPISWSLREDILTYTKNFLPFSDYNFNSLLAWDVENNLSFSDLNGNLVIRMPNYLTREDIVSFIGENKINDTAHTLLTYTKEQNIPQKLSLIPHTVRNRLDETVFATAEDPDNHDYIYSTQKLALLKGREYKSKRHLAVGFRNQYPEHTFATKPLSVGQSRQQVLDVLDNWTVEQQDQNQDDIRIENGAIRKLLDLAGMYHDELVFSMLKVDNDIIGFSIDEILGHGFALSHFHKTKHTYKGVTEFLNQKTADFLFRQGVEFWNWEQDLAVPGLKRSKLSYRPVHFLKKYTVTFT